MTPEEKSLLERTYKLAEDNNRILRSIRRGNRLSTAMRIIYWVAIIASGISAYYLIQPYIESVSGMYSQAQDNLNSAQNTIQSFRDLTQ